MSFEIEEVDVERTEEFLGPIMRAFGVRPNPERLGSWKLIDEVAQRLAVFDRNQIVGAAGTFAFDMTVPGGTIDVAGLTTVAVVPTHRRRGIMKALVTRHLRDARERGCVASALWASESSIYGRFGYGLASHVYHARIHARHTDFQVPVEPRGALRLVEPDEAAQLFPPIWERVRPSMPGMLSRSNSWWRLRRLCDRNDRVGPLQRVVLEIDGRPEAYALYNLSGKLTDYTLSDISSTVVEAMGATPAATRAMWRYLFDVDLVEQVNVDLLPVDHVLVHGLVDMRRLHLGVSDGVWLRLLDVPEALRARHYAVDDSLAIGVTDDMFPDNTGTYRIDGDAGQIARLDGAAKPDIQLSVKELGAVYLGGMSFSQLHAAGRLEVFTEGAARRADALFHYPSAPWCPEIF